MIHQIFLSWPIQDAQKQLMRCSELLRLELLVCVNVEDLVEKTATSTPDRI
jgi:hypothetical protein